MSIDYDPPFWRIRVVRKDRTTKGHVLDDRCQTEPEAQALGETYVRTHGDEFEIEVFPEEPDGG